MILKCGDVVVTDSEMAEQRAFVARMLRDAADKVERSQRANLDWGDALITRMVRDPDTGMPKRVVDGYELHVKMWDEP